MRKWNKTYNAIRYFAAVVIMGSMLFVASCNDSDDPKPAVEISFATDAKIVGEVGGPQSVTIKLLKDAPRNGTLTLEASPANASSYLNFPETIDITKGTSFVQFTVFPLNNGALDGTREVTLTLTDPSSGFKLGELTSMTIHLTDDESPAEANFEEATSTVAEDNATGADVTVLISSPALGSGDLSVTIASDNATYGTHFTTDPAAVGGVVSIPFAEDATSVSFKVIPVDNNDVNEPRDVEFTITGSSSPAVTVGEIIATHTVSLTDNETPSTIDFDVATSLVEETAEVAGQTISFDLAPETQGSGTVTLSISSATATYGTDFTTDPAATGGNVVVPVSSGATTASFKIIPIDNTTAATSAVVTFEMVSSTGIVVIGSNKTHQVTIEDDDTVTPIATVRGLYTGSNATINTSVRINGIVTSSNPQVSAQNVWIQDATGGIVVRFTANNTLLRGDEVTIQLKAGEMTEFSGLLQVQNVANAKATVLSSGNPPPAAETISVAQLNTGAYEGKLVSVSDVAFVEADGTLTMSGTRAISDGTNTANVRTESGASFASSPMPLGIGTITGLAGENGGAKQIIPIVFASDVFGSSAAGTINVTQALTNFGSVNNGATSAVQTYTVSGTDLQRDLVITVPFNYEISDDDISYGSQLTYTAAAINGNTKTMYMRFKPQSGENQVIPGKINHKALGAVTQSISISGTETGNAPIPQLMVENFNYGSSANSDLVNAAINWTKHNSATPPPQYSTSSLSYTGYPGISTGGSVSFGTTGADINRKFTQVSSNGTVYVSFLVNLSSAGSRDYFFHLGPNTIGSTFRARVFATANGSGWNIGFAKNSVNADNTSTLLEFNKTYLVVLKYVFSTTTTSDDVVSLFLYDSGIPPTEAGTPLVSIANIGAGDTSDPANIGSIAIRQGSSTPVGVIDGIRVATNWNDLFN